MNRNYYNPQTWPLLDLTNPQAPIYTPAGGTIRSLSPSCYRIEVKNTITITDASIVTCTGTDPATCSEPGSCPTTVDPATTGYYNLKARMTASVAQDGIIIEFDYLFNDTPVVAPNNQVSIDYTAGDVVTGYKDFYLFQTGNQALVPITTNQALGPGDTVSLYGARVV